MTLNKIGSTGMPKIQIKFFYRHFTRNTNVMHNSQNNFEEQGIVDILNIGFLKLCALIF